MDRWSTRSIRTAVAVLALAVLIITVTVAVKSSRKGKASAAAVPAACQEAIADAERIGQIARRGFADSSGYVPLVERAAKAGMTHNSSAIEAIAHEGSEVRAKAAADDSELTLVLEAFNIAKARC